MYNPLLTRRGYYRRTRLFLSDSSSSVTSNLFDSVSEISVLASCALPTSSPTLSPEQETKDVINASTYIALEGLIDFTHWLNVMQKLNTIHYDAIQLYFDIVPYTIRHNVDGAEQLWAKDLPNVP